jgi:hypothetical protein
VSGSGQYRTPDRILGELVPALRAAAEQIDTDLAAFGQPHAKPGPAKAMRIAANIPALERFRASVDRLDEFDWSWQRIGEYLGCTKQNVMSVYHGHSMVPAYMLDKLDLLPELQALPAKLRAQQLRRAG